MFSPIELSQLSAMELEALIDAAAFRRATMRPALPVEAPEACEPVLNPAWFTFPTESGSVLRFRHPGLGWIDYLIPAQERAHLLSLLLNQALQATPTAPLADLAAMPAGVRIH